MCTRLQVMDTEHTLVEHDGVGSPEAVVVVQQHLLRCHPETDGVVDVCRRPPGCEVAYHVRMRICFPRYDASCRGRIGSSGTCWLPGRRACLQLASDC